MKAYYLRLYPGLTVGGTVKGDPAKDIVKAAFDAGVDRFILLYIFPGFTPKFQSGINMFDTAESYSGGQSEVEMYVRCYNGRIIMI